MPVISATNLGFTYSTRLQPALDGLSFEVSIGETVLVLGPSGSGKSTLTLCLDGLIPHLVEGEYRGEVVVAGLVVGDSPVHLLAQQAGLIFQDPESQFCTLTVEDEIAFGLENIRRTPQDIETAIDNALLSVGLAGYRGRRLTTLSGGEKQRVALAAVLAMGPRVLVLDEPSANLDPRATADLFKLLRSIAADRQHAIFIIEHKIDQIIEWVDSVLVLTHGGRLLFRGDPATAFYERAAELADSGVWRPQTSELVLALRDAGWPVPGNPLSVEETASALLVTPGLIDKLRSRPPLPGREVKRRLPVIHTEDLSYRYPDGHQALTNVCMSLGRGDFLAIAGENGAGKSTLACLLSGVLDAPRASVFLEGKDMAREPLGSVSDKVGYVFQNPEHQFVTDSVFGELAFSLRPGAKRKKAIWLTAQEQVRVEKWLDRLGLLPLAEAHPFSLSQGQKRRLSVAAMLIRGQSVLILDEPTLGQDELQSEGLMSLMEELRREGRTVAVVTHDMRLVSEYADTLLVLAKGCVLFFGTPREFFAKPYQAESAGLALPTLGQVSALLHGEAGTPTDIHTIDAFVLAVNGSHAMTFGTRGA